ncbi:MAG: hypothetical protein KatS3mg022_0561 [Armatimonadota bacterium]|nr:MAG: hypothetical protein KatS3mg022_0561 [Armatimonadota bacterium]
MGWKIASVPRGSQGHDGRNKARLQSLYRVTLCFFKNSLKYFSKPLDNAAIRSYNLAKVF